MNECAATTYIPSNLDLKNSPVSSMKSQPCRQNIRAAMAGEVHVSCFGLSID